jgi:enoyl-CoA hydratase
MTVTIEKDGPIWTVILSRPEARNAVNPETAIELADAFRRFDADKDARVGVFYGDHGTFCAGYDLKVVGSGQTQSIEQRSGDGPMGPSRFLLDKPVIGAISGYAVAGGLELALWCDMRVVEEGTIFGVYCRRWGVPLIDGGTVRLPRIVGQSRALDMILTGRPVDAKEALAWGLADRLVPKGKSREEAEKLAREIAKFPQLCMRTDRRSAYLGFDYSLEEALANEGRDGFKVLAAESVTGAARFASGKGRGGKFDDI